MARRARTVTALIAILLGVGLMAPTAQAASATRSSSFVYDTASGLLMKEVIEPNDPQLCLVTEYQYDAYGNKTSVTTRNCNGGTGEGSAPAAGSDAVIQSRTTTSTYDVRGQFAETTTNALNHTETRAFDPKFGGVTSLIGPNGLETKWDYDSFGRKIKETRADNTTTTWTYVPYNKSWPYMGHYWLAYYVSTAESGSIQPSYTYYDSLNRKLLTSRRNMANADWIDEGNTIYDSRGQIEKVYLPYERSNSGNAKYTLYKYDDLGRATSETTPNDTPVTSDDTTTVEYTRLTVKITNNQGQTKTTVKNTQGQTVKVTDAQGKNLTYVYDPFGNLTQTTDALGNVTKLKYDFRGRKTEMNDPDMGIWTYAYNALGELIRQVDAKGQTVTMAYDKLGRMTSRNEPDLVSTWTYDTAAMGIGKLATATSDNGYSRSHTYDALGRLSSTSTVIDDPAKPYVTSTSYDSIGRVSVQTYPASPAHPNGFAVKNVYNGLNYLIKVLNAANNALLWQANTMDAMGHLTQQTYGNGIVTQQVYNPVTGRLEQQLAGAGNAVQNMSYQYDSLGNLSTRTDINNNLTETYTYDTINRVTSATSISGAVNVTRTFAYDAIGNIVCKSDISGCDAVTPNYTYNASGANSIRPHAVAGIIGTVNGVVNPAFQYDANGNMLSGAGRSIVWTSFNIPSQITSGTKTVGFWYNSEHERTREQQADGSIVVTLSPRYDTGLHFEKKTFTVKDPVTGTLIPAVEYEHYLYAGGQMFGKYVNTTTPAGTPVTAPDGTVLVPPIKTTYYSKDHLGSIVAITDEAGAVIQRLSYDVWGKRRYPNGEADPNGLLNNPDMYHGYTGHEMLDDVGLIHMNGRLYDPVMGRFISADLYIQAPGNLQSYNRYSYGFNNPLSGTDPSGYSWIKKFFHNPVSALVDSWHTVWHNPTVQNLITAWIATNYGPGWAAAYNGARTMSQGGSFGDGLRSAAMTYANLEYGPASFQAFAVRTGMTCIGNGGARCIGDVIRGELTASLKQMALTELFPRPGTCQGIAPGEGCMGRAGPAVNHIFPVLVVAGEVAIEAGAGTAVRNAAIWVFRSARLGSVIERAIGIMNEAEDQGDKPSLLDPEAETHVLDGDATGGGHRSGGGKPGKSEFPGSWSDRKITGEISDVATDPGSSRVPGRGGRTVVSGTRGGVNIDVIVEPNGRIVTGYPTNVPRNPR